MLLVLTCYRLCLALVTAELDAHAEVPPELARRVGVGSGDQIRLDTRRGSAVLRAGISDNIRADTVFVPFHRVGCRPPTP